MIAKHVTVEQMNRALAQVNEKYDGNVQFRRMDPVGVRFPQVNFTLKVGSSRGPGHRLGIYLTSKGKRRRYPAACWHVHGAFFDALLGINPDAVIKSHMATITKAGGNWEDRNIGSIMDPLYFSEACECGEEQ